jgi:hypothetical protein
VRDFSQGGQTRIRFLPRRCMASCPIDSIESVRTAMAAQVPRMAPGKRSPPLAITFRSLAGPVSPAIPGATHSEPVFYCDDLVRYRI